MLFLYLGVNRLAWHFVCGLMLVVVDLAYWNVQGPIIFVVKYGLRSSNYHPNPNLNFDSDSKATDKRQMTQR